MNIFISWSGDRSRAIAEALRGWLPNVIQSLKPWMSKEDISKGARWSPEIAQALKDCPIGIVCLTPENLTAPYLLFEAGALSNNVETQTVDNKQIITGKTAVCTYLYELTPTDVKQPLADFQATVANKEETKRLLLNINEHMGEQKLPVTQVEKFFEKWWPDLEQALTAIPKPKTTAKAGRTPDDMLTEILTTVRRIDQRNEPIVYLSTPHGLVREEEMVENMPSRENWNKKMAGIISAGLASGKLKFPKVYASEPENPETPAAK